jgi:putative hemolysin
VTSILVFSLIFSLLALAVVSGAETALFSLSSMQIKAFKRDVDPRKRLAAFLLSNPKDLLITLIILIIIFSLAIQNIVSTLFEQKSSWALNVGIPLGLNLILGEMIPKSLSLPNNVKISCRVAKLLSLLQKILFPVRKFLTVVTNWVVNFLFFFLKKEKEISVDELQHALRTSKEHGVLNPDEAELIRGYLHLQESTVKELMRPREEVIYFDIEQPVSKLLHLFVDQECSRIPLCEGNLDKLLGIISSRLFFLHRPTIKETKDLIPVLKKPFFVPETMSADSLLRQLYEKKESLAIVVDEYGSISGIIALEDLVEVVIGEIVDRRDEKMSYTRAGKDIIIASGKFELSEFEEIFQTTLESENNMVTIGGWLTEQMGDIPKTGTKFTTKEFLFHVLSADPNRVRRVYIRRISSPPSKKSKEE